VCLSEISVLKSKAQAKENGTFYKVMNGGGGHAEAAGTIEENYLICFGKRKFLFRPFKKSL
jgi:hypothetical protein